MAVACASDILSSEQAEYVLNTRHAELEAELLTKVSLLEGKRKWDAVQKFIHIHNVTTATVYSGRQPHLWDSWALEYLDVKLEYLEYSGDGIPPWEVSEPNYYKFDADKEKILKEAVSTGVPEKYITGHQPGDYQWHLFQDPKVQNLVTQYRDMEDTLRPYWRVTDELFQGYPEQLELYKEWVNASSAMERGVIEQKARAAGLNIKKGDRLVKRAREQMRRDNPDIDAALVELYGYIPIEEQGPRGFEGLEGFKDAQGLGGFRSSK